MKKGWQIKKLGELCDIERGGSPRPILEFITTDVNGINWIKIGDATASGKYIFKTEEKIKPEGVKRSRMVYEGDFILSNSMSFGRPYIMKTTGCIHDGWLVLHQPQVDPDYLYYVLSSDLIFDQFDRLAAGSTVRNLNIGLAKSVEIPYPPLAEQQRIVSILDDAFEKIATAKANAEKNLQNARALFESHLNDVFTKQGKGWVEKSLGEISQFKNGLNYNKSSGGQTLPVVGVADFQDNYFVPLSELQTATIDGDLADNYAIHMNDILIVRSNGSKHLVGRSMLVGEVKEVVSYSGFIIRIRLDTTNIFSRFLLHFLKCPLTRDILTAGGGGANIMNINQEKLSSLLVGLPPYKTQIRIASELDALSSETQRLEAIYRQKLAALEALKKSLLDQAFSGGL
jgi:type I restriction enzyme S subunit